MLGGAVTRSLMGQRVARDLVTMVDYAQHWRDEEIMSPVYVDDEGTPAEDAVLIERGILRVESGQAGAALSELMISGNMAQMPRDGVAVSAERQDTGDILLPRLRIAGLHFSRAADPPSPLTPHPSPLTPHPELIL